jgi:hypothetical protein
MSHNQITGQNNYIKVVNKYFYKYGRVKIFGNDSANQNSVYEEIESRLNLGNDCCRAFQNLLSSQLLPKSVKIKIYSANILPIILCGCETWALTLRKQIESENI